MGWLCMTETKQPEIAGPEWSDFTQIEKLYRVYGRFAYGLASKQLGNEQAENIVHEAFLRFWQEPGLRNLKGPAFFSWLLNEVQHLRLVQPGNTLDRPAPGPGTARQ